MVADVVGLFSVVAVEQEWYRCKQNPDTPSIASTLSAGKHLESEEGAGKAMLLAAAMYNLTRLP